MYINWSTLVPTPQGVLIPTYGNYGGPGYSDGEILTDPNQPVDYSSTPVDDLDALFLTHDQAYDSLDPVVRAEGDVELAEGIAALTDSQLDAEASLYGGFATLVAIDLILNVNRQPEVLSLESLAHLTQSALHDIGRGLAQSDPAELAAIQTWLAQTAGDVVEVSELLEAEQVFDFGRALDIALVSDAEQVARQRAPESDTLLNATPDLLSRIDGWEEAAELVAITDAGTGLHDAVSTIHSIAPLYDLFA